MNSKLLLKHIVAAIVAINLAACGGGSTTANEANVSLLAFNDLHGKLENGASALLVDPANPNGTKVSLGGVAYMTTLIKSLKAENPQGTLVIANGDLIGAAPLISRAFHDEPTIDVLNEMGLAVSSVGNHEFDKGKDELLRLTQGGCFKGGVIGVDTCLVNGKFAGANFEYLAANVIDTSTGKSLLPGYTIKTVNGVKVGFIGLTLEATPSVVAAGGTDGLTFNDEVKTINGLVPELKKQGVALIAVLLHNGGTTTAKVINDQTCPGLSVEIASLTDQISPDVDVVYNGHSHQGYNCVRPDGKLLVNSANYGQMVSKTDLTIDLNSNKVIKKSAYNHAVVNDLVVKDGTGAPIPVPAAYKILAKDSVVDQMVAFYKNLIKPITDQVVGTINVPMSVVANSAGESVLADFIADVFLWETSQRPAYIGNPAQIAFTNLGGVRADLPNTTVTFGNLNDVLPFGNMAVTKDLTGSQIYRLLEQQWESPQPNGNGRMLAFSKNFAYSWDANKPAGAAPGTGNRVVAGSVKINGAPIDLVKTYRVTTNDYIANGGDNMSVMKLGTNSQDGRLDLDFTKDYFVAFAGTVSAPDPTRVTKIN